MSRASITSINQLFSVLAGTYGADWQRQLEAAPPGDVKSAWMFQLERFSGSMFRIDWALDNLPDRCPNAVQFRNLCASAPSPEALRLPEPKADPVRVAAELAKLAPLRVAVTGNNPHSMRAWAYRLKARHDAGETLNMNQIRCYNEALGTAA